MTNETRKDETMTSNQLYTVKFAEGPSIEIDDRSQAEVLRAISECEAEIGHKLAVGDIWDVPPLSVFFRSGEFVCTEAVVFAKPPGIGGR